MNRAPATPLSPLESHRLESASGPAFASLPPAPARGAGSGIRPEVLARVLQLIDQRFGEPLRVEDLGRHASLSPFHFARMFKISVGQAPHAYLTSKRMQHARELLAGTAMPIADIARRVGFRTQAHFSGVFRKQVGATPGQYRRQHRRDADAVQAEPQREAVEA